MDILYIPQLDEAGLAGDSDGIARYRILRRVPENGVVTLVDRAVTKIDLATSESVKLILPPEVKGAARDFFVRIVITSDVVPEITFAPPTGETISFEDTDEDVFACEIGVNIFAFTETDSGVFIVNLKEIDIEHLITFDACGGQVDYSEMKYRLGTKYGSLPVPQRTGYQFTGWYTAAEGGEVVTNESRVKSSITVLYAQWKSYIDIFSESICTTGNLVFQSVDVVPWILDESVFASAPSSAKSGMIGDSERTSLKAVVSGPGTVSFKWKVSSEKSYDFLRFLVDGTEVENMSGEVDWSTYEYTLTGEGEHALEWKYEKDGSNDSGSDCGWIDDVSWVEA